MACKCDNAEMHARAVEEAIFNCLLASGTDEEKEKWRRRADTLEHKFTTDHGKHYSEFIAR